MSSATSGILPTYVNQRFVNGLSGQLLFSRRSFRPRAKYIIVLAVLTFCAICFGTFFFLPDFRDAAGQIQKQIQRAGPELLIPIAPHPHASQEMNHVIKRPGIQDKSKLKEKIDKEFEQQKTLEKPEVVSDLRVQVSSTTPEKKVPENEVKIVPPAIADRMPIIVGGEDPDAKTRKRRDTVKEVSRSEGPD